jgi:hypothetical protein
MPNQSERMLLLLAFVGISVGCSSVRPCSDALGKVGFKGQESRVRQVLYRFESILGIAEDTLFLNPNPMAYTAVETTYKDGWQVSIHHWQVENRGLRNRDTTAILGALVDMVAVAKKEPNGHYICSDTVYSK